MRQEWEKSTEKAKLIIENRMKVIGNVEDNYYME